MEAIPVPAGELGGIDAEREELALRARSDSEAFGQLYLLHREPVLRYLRAISASTTGNTDSSTPWMKA